MKKERWKKISRIFDLALALPEERRTTYINHLCSGNPDLEKEVNELLMSVEASDQLLKDHLQKNEALLRDLTSHLGQSETPRSLVGSTLGQWKLVDLLGRGGMGDVYKAERTDSDIHQQGALKIMRRGLDTPENVRRFRLEKQILAGLHHPHIASLIEGGVSDDGLPYLVMEYVEGISITSFCDQRELTVKERLELFKKVCRAVQHAHKNLVVHRDLKPENILVTEEGHVKILDFGIAKLLEPDFYEVSTVETRQGMRLMSLEYAAPEQISGEAVNISTDLYTLGVLMFELLTGQIPFGSDDISHRSLRHKILKEEPAAPSRIIRSFSTGIQADLSDKRSVGPGKLSGIISGDLDAITLKALRKNPAERYDSVGELLLDIDAFLQDKPVLARNDSTRYRIKKFFKRQKKGFTVVIFFLVTVSSLVTYYTFQLAEERDLAQQEAQRAEQVKDFMLDIFELNNPALAQFDKGDISSDKLLVQGIKTAEEKLSDQPEIYIEVLQELGFTLTSLNAFDAAQKAYNKALQKSLKHNGMMHPQTANLFNHMADFNNKNGNLDSAEVLIHRSISINKDIYGEAHKEIADDYHIYGEILRNKGNYIEAKKYHQKAESLYVKSGQQASTSRFINLFNLGITLNKLGDYKKSEQLLLRVLAHEEQSYEEPSIHIATTKHKLGSLYEAMGNYKKGERFLSEALDSQRALLGSTHSFHIGPLLDLTGLELAQNNLDRAEKYAKEAVRICRQVFSEDNVGTLRSLDALALVKTKKGEIEEAKSIYREVIRKKRRLFGDNSASLAVALYNFGMLLHKNSEYEEALPLFKEVVKIDKISLGKQSPDVAIDLNKLAALQRDMGRFVEAESSFSEARAIFEEKFPKDHYRIAEFWVDYGRLKLQQGDYESAQKFLEKGHRIFTNEFGVDDERAKEAAGILERAESRLAVKK